jgi:spore coat protein U-like protein
MERPRDLTEETKVMRKQAVRLVAGVAVAGTMAAAGTWSQGSEAATHQANVAVSASVSANCLVGSGSISFGSYDPLNANLSSPLDATGTFTVQCTRGVTADVGLGDGQNFAGGRQMENTGDSGEFLGYELYSDNSRSTVWDNAAGRVSYTAPNRSAATLTIYGRVPANQDPVPGTYEDTVVAIAEF